MAIFRSSSELPQGAVLRPFAYAGVSLLSEDGWKTKSKLAYRF